MKTVAIIPARGGSKRIPGKNIRPFLGKPVIAYSIEAALKSNLFDEVMVSTDSEEIAAIAKDLGAKVPFMRSAKNADDHATTADVLLEVLQEYEQRDKVYTYACCMYPTAPLITINRLSEVYAILVKDGLDSAFPVVVYDHPIQRALEVINRRARMISPEYLHTRTQDLPPAYHDAGQFYWMNVKSFLTQRRLFMEHNGAVIISRNEAQDIDTEADWELAELKYQHSRAVH